MRISGGTIILIIVLLPFIPTLVYYIASLVKAFKLPDYGIAETWYTKPFFILRGLFIYLRDFLFDTRVLALLLGIGLVVAVLTEGK